jgi:hypothetical protein
VKYRSRVIIRCSIQLGLVPKAKRQITIDVSVRQFPQTCGLQLTDQYFTDAREMSTGVNEDELTEVNAIVLKYNDLRLSNSIASDPHSECQTAHKAFRLLESWRWVQTEDWDLEGRCRNDDSQNLRNTPACMEACAMAGESSTLGDKGFK